MPPDVRELSLYYYSSLWHRRPPRCKISEVGHRKVQLALFLIEQTSKCERVMTTQKSTTTLLHLRPAKEPCCIFSNCRAAVHPFLRDGEFAILGTTPLSLYHPLFTRPFRRSCKKPECWRGSMRDEEIFLLLLLPGPIYPAISLGFFLLTWCRAATEQIFGQKHTKNSEGEGESKMENESLEKAGRTYYYAPLETCIR